MWIVWIAILVSVALTLFISSQVDDIGAFDIPFLFVFFLCSTNVIVELMKLILRKRKINDYGGLTSYAFREVDYSFWEGGIFFRESIINIKGKGIFKLWANFVISLIWIVFSLYMILYVIRP
jgi:hypothetical protein